VRALEGRAEAGWREEKLEEQFKVGSKMEAMLHAGKQTKFDYLETQIEFSEYSVCRRAGAGTAR
jgi:hypothetical protein